MIFRLKRLEAGAASPALIKEISLVKQGKIEVSKELYHEPVVLSPQNGSLLTLDGKIPWEDYLSPFNPAVMVRGWTRTVRVTIHFEATRCFYHFEAIFWQ